MLASLCLPGLAHQRLELLINEFKYMRNNLTFLM